jgi:hypothetical protein
MNVPPAEPGEIFALASLYDGWQDAHAPILPHALARARTRESFAEQLTIGLADLRVIRAAGAPLGFCMLKGDELYQLDVSAEAVVRASPPP